MGILVGYKNNVDYVNTKPEVKHDIYALSKIGTSRYSKSAPPTASVETVLARPVKYYFHVVTKAKTETSAFRLCYYFDDKAQAMSEHKALKLKLYDQLTRPYLKKTNSKGRLSLQDQLCLQSIFERIDSI